MKSFQIKEKLPKENMKRFQWDIFTESFYLFGILYAVFLDDWIQLHKFMSTWSL
jgi:hypothetical protein